MATKHWIKEDESLLKEKFKTLSNKELAEFFGVSTIAIQRKLSRMGLIRQTQKKWTPEEEEYLKANYAGMKDRELAKYFRVSEIAIRRKLNRLNLRRNERRDEEKKKAPIQRITKKEYNLSQEYRIGDMIYHSIFGESGKVVGKENTHSGLHVIVVEFKQKGLVKLVECAREDF
ncbi:MAG: hypothetical protein PHQ23_05910 [Candidatus Wallbacteria bacterium]|nr:hypothetical protein [Candidatus Wallbacteria bacterium]